MEGQAVWPVAVFAYNEEKRIGASIERLLALDVPGRMEIHVLVNGCTDDTLGVVRSHARRHANVIPHVIALGDKANAWNHYVHAVAPDAPVHFFTDGDVVIEPSDALVALARTLAENPKAYLAAAVPADGRNAEETRAAILRERRVAGNLYAARGTFLARMRAQGVRMPVGQIGEDGLIECLAKWDLNPRQSWDLERVVGCAEARFRYRSLSPWRLSDWRLYLRRRIRYSIREHQDRMLGPVLKAGGIEAMPATVQDLYRLQFDRCRLHRGGLDILFDRVARARIAGALRRSPA